MNRRTHRRRLAAAAAALGLLAAPAANARFDEGSGTEPTGQTIVRVADADGFSWDAAAIGAGAALGAVALVGMGRAVRRHDLPAHS
jgi:hypothetical protein